MAAITAPAPVSTVVDRSKVAWAISDALTVTKRNMIAMTRIPQVLVFSTVQPVIFVMMFRYVFGGAISVPHARYVDYLMPGIFVQTVTFGSVQTGIGLAEDLQKGLIERFRSLAMARSAVLAGRTIADAARNVFVVALMVAVGFLVGFHLGTNFAELLLACGVLLFFGFAISWVMATIGLMTRNAEAAQAASFPIMALLVFASTSFVSARSMPGWLQVYANHQPVSATLDAARALMLNGPYHAHVVSKVLVALAWGLGIIVVFAPLAVARYRRTA